MRPSSQATPDAGRSVISTADFFLPFSREQLWEYFSNTDWLNRAIGLPPVEYVSRLAANGEKFVEGRTRLGPFTLRWREFPFEWQRPVSSLVRREFAGGPFKSFEGGMELHEEPNGSRLRMRSEIVARNPLGEWLAKFVINPNASRRLTRAVTQVRRILGSSSGVAVRLPPLNLSPVNESPLNAGLEALRGAGCTVEECSRIEQLVRYSDDVEAVRLRPFELAKKWTTPRWDVVRLFLLATRAGLLDLSWEVICPSCLEDREPSQELGRLRSEMHCQTCQVAFDAEFDRSVELKFSINPAIRTVGSSRFCLGGVNFRQDCICQLTVEPGQERELTLDPGRYFLRSAELLKAVPFDVTMDCENAANLVIRRDGSVDLPELSGRSVGQWRILNERTFPVTCRAEQLRDHDEILTAAEATNWQEFRDLFAREVVAPNERLTVGRQVFLFTDLRGSTQMYQTIGDAPAYTKVRDHFNALTSIVKRRHGAVVKTIGDAVMAVFTSPGEAVASAIEMQLELRRGATDESLKLKAAVHLGPCLAVNANGLLDYFGTTVNYAARLLGTCQADEVVISNVAYQAAEVVEFLRGLGMAPISFQCTLRGVLSEQTVWKLPTGGLTPFTVPFED